MSLQVGESLGNYSILDYINQGGHATVYKCEHKTAKIVRAIKVAEKASMSQKKENRFRSEVKIHKQMQHPHIINTYESGETNDYHFLVMDYAPDTLRQVSRPQDDLSIIVPLVKQMALALAHVHSKNIVHCDVKPENMLITPGKNILLCDFGIAVSTFDVIKDIYGTVEYVAPEVMVRRQCPASDQYALAITIYEWLADTCPFDNAHALRTQPVPSLCQIVPTLDAAIDAVIRKALAKEPQDRYPDVLSFASAFEQACQRTQKTVSPSSPVVPLIQPVITASSSPANSGRRTRLLGQQIGMSVNKTVLLFPPSLADHCLFVYEGHKHNGRKRAVNAVAWSPDGTKLVTTATDRTVKVWDVANGNDLFTYRSHARVVLNASWSWDGLTIASADEAQVVRLWNPTTGDTVFRYQHRVGQPDEVGIASDYPLAWSHDGRSIVSASADQPLEKWNTLTGNRLLTYHDHTSDVTTLAWSPDETKIASGSRDKTVHVWDAATGAMQYIYHEHRDTVRTLAWSPDGKNIASASSDGILRVWNAINGKAVFVYTGHTRSVNSLAWSPDGSKIVTAASDDTLRIVNAITGTIVAIYRGHTDMVNMVAWSPIGDVVASASEDGTVRLWEV